MAERLRQLRAMEHLGTHVVPLKGLELSWECDAIRFLSPATEQPAPTCTGRLSCCSEKILQHASTLSFPWLRGCTDTLRIVDLNYVSIDVNITPPLGESTTQQDKYTFQEQNRHYEMYDFEDELIFHPRTKDDAVGSISMQVDFTCKLKWFPVHHEHLVVAHFHLDADVVVLDTSQNRTARIAVVGYSSLRLRTLK